MPTITQSKLTGKDKAAILLVALGPELASEVLKHCNDEVVERLTRQVLALSKVSEDVKRQVVEECYADALAHNFISTGGAEYARDMLKGAFGEAKADELIARVIATARPHPFDFLRDGDPEQLTSFIQNEHPQTIALVLSHLRPSQAAAVLSSLEEGMRADLAMRIAAMDRTSPEVVKRVENVMRKKASVVLDHDYSTVGGVEFLVKVLNNVDRGTEKGILERLGDSDSELAADIRKLMFVFEDVAKLDDRSLQRILREVDFRDLALGLRGASEELQNKVFKNLSSRSAEMLKEEMGVSGPVRVRNVEEAQQRIVAIIRRLDEAEEIFISRGDDVII